MTKFKIGVLALVGALLLAFGAFGLQSTEKASANPTALTGPAAVSSGVAASYTADFAHDDAVGFDAYTIAISPSAGATITVTACRLDTDGDGLFNDAGSAACAILPGASATDAIVEAFDGNATSEAFEITFDLTVTCAAVEVRTLSITQSAATISQFVTCNPPAAATATPQPTITPQPTATVAPTSTAAALTADNVTVLVSPATLEVFPATGSQVASLIRVLVKDSNGQDVVGNEVVAVATSGAIDTKNDPTNSTLDLSDTDGNGFVAECEQGTDSSPLQDETLTLSTGNIGIGGIARFVYCARALSSTGSTLTATLGKNTITIIVHQDEALVNDVIKTVDITVVGPPAAITISASPTTLRCGEKATITGTVKDAIGQTVSPNTPVSLVTNFGGVLAPGAAGFGGIGTVSTDASGGFTSFLLTSTTNQGPYEVVAGVDSNGDGAADTFAQVTVTCSAAAATAVPTTGVSAPTTGQGITVANTGDGGLARSSSGWTLFAIGGLAAFALAGLATMRFARR